MCDEKRDNALILKGKIQVLMEILELSKVYHGQTEKVVSAVIKKYLLEQI